MFLAYIRNSRYRMHRYYCSKKMEVILAVIIAAGPIATSGDSNVYIAWWSNKTGNDELMFNASTN